MSQYEQAICEHGLSRSLSCFHCAVNIKNSPPPRVEAVVGQPPKPKVNDQVRAAAEYLILFVKTRPDTPHFQVRDGVIKKLHELIEQAQRSSGENTNGK